MLERVKFENGVVAYTSPLLRAAGVPHAFSTRIGGVSPPPFDSMNLGNPSGCALQDDDARIQENYRRLHDAIGCAGRTRCWVHQVHGANVQLIRPMQAWTNGPKADALVTDDDARVLAVRVADCVPILLASGDGRIVAAVHAGWRGVVANVVGVTLRKMSELKCHPDGVLAAIGPCIGLDAFEVGEEVAVEFERLFGVSSVRRADDAKPHVDLRGSVHRQLTDVGVRRVDLTDRCTFRDREEFFSHRRDHGVTGRMAALIAPGGS